MLKRTYTLAVNVTDVAGNPATEVKKYFKVIPQENRGKNIGIIRPRRLPPKKQLAKSTPSFSTKNNTLNFQMFSTRKSQTYNQTSTDKNVINKQQQSKLESNVGQLDRMNRLKAKNNK